jgi:TIR domain/WD domain, G-beta repeat
MASTYDAFISYSHAADGTLAPALQDALQRFAKPWYRLRALHLFRDQTSLSATPGLWPAIETALQASRYFLLLASPEAAASRWVQQEVEWWLEHKSPQTLLIALTDGTIVRHPGATDFDWSETGTTALPPILMGVFVENPLWVDFRWAKGQEHLSSKNPQFQNALAALAAPLRNIPKEDLIGEDVRQHRRALLLARGATVVLVLLLIVAIGAAVLALRNQAEAESQRSVAVAERDRAEEQSRISLARALAAQAVSETERGQHERGALLARQAYLVDEASGGKVHDRVDAALRTALNVPHFSHRLWGHKGLLYAVTFAPDGRLASAGDDGVRVGDPGHPEVAPLVLEVHEGVVLSVAFSPDGRTLASGGGEDGTVRLWDLTNPEADPLILEGHENGVYSVAFAPDGRLALGGDDGVRVWDPAHAEVAALVMKGHGGFAHSVDFAPDGRTLASAGLEGTVRLWALTNPAAEPLVLEVHEGVVLSVAFAPGGRTLATGGTDGTVRVWDLINPEAAPLVLEGHEGVVHSVTFVADGRLASTGQDRTVRLWDLTNPEAAPVVLQGHEDEVTAVDVALDGRTLASGSQDGTVRLWMTDPETLADLVCTRVWRNLTLDEWSRFVGDPEQVPYQPTCLDLPSGEAGGMETPASGTPVTSAA